MSSILALAWFLVVGFSSPVIVGGPYDTPEWCVWENGGSITTVFDERGWPLSRYCLLMKVPVLPDTPEEQP